MRRVSSMEGDGILKACTMNILMSMARTSAIITASAGSLAIFLTFGPYFFFLFSLSRYVSAVALGDDVFSQGLYRIPRYDPPAYGRLYDDLEHLPRYDGLHLLDYISASVKRLIPRRYDGKGVHVLAVYEYV